MPTIYGNDGRYERRMRSLFFGDDVLFLHWRVPVAER